VVNNLKAQITFCDINIKLGLVSALGTLLENASTGQTLTILLPTVL
jgi:hypothetical protein